MSTLYAQRTNGDGMENPDDADELLLNRTGRLSLEKLIYKPGMLNSFTACPPVIPPESMICLKPPQSASYSNKDPSLKTLKGREPKFVPYEPYKAAVNPIIPITKKEKARKISKIARSSTSVELASTPDECCSITSKGNSVVDFEKQTLREELEDLEAKNQQLEKELKFQAQVNMELKSMLVAAVGEDLEVRVQHLTEDKLQLAHALLKSAQNLDSHQEQLEWLAGQCEVWRSKFLASSLMLEEMARSKAGLYQKAQELRNVLRDVMDEKLPTREHLLKSHRNMQVLRDTFDPASGMVHSFDNKSWSNSKHPSNSMELAASCEFLSECLSQRLLGTTAPSVLQSPTLSLLDMGTPSEQKASKLLQMGADLLGTLPDAACSAVVGCAAAVGGGLFPHIGNTPTTCCAHCSGDIKTL